MPTHKIWTRFLRFRRPRSVIGRSIAICGLIAVSIASLAAFQADEQAPNGDKNTARQDKTSRNQHGATKHAANHLAGETSPYLLMHVHNPVDWYPWGEEALAKARKENRPIFLSIGYSSCYWCHVMERESFTDEQIAAYLNKHFVCIKVDREERPDLDDIYMTSVQIITRRGGWPMSVFLTPQGKPFFGGTYFPPRKSKKYPHPGFFELLQKVDRAWNTNRSGVEQSADRLTDAIRQNLQRPTNRSGAKIDAKLVARTSAALDSRFDEKIGGFGWSPTNPRMPKFPEPTKLEFLLGRASAGDGRAKEMLVTTLDRMARGGIYDHLGGGFHRYSTDRFWWVPHFEKMLYDNGLLASVYARTHALLGTQGRSDRFNFGDVARGICDFILREMTSPDGGFYAAIDAETDAEEGKFYVWTDGELASTLDATELKLLNDVYIWKTGELVSALPLPPKEIGTLRLAFGNADSPIFEERNVLMLGKRPAELAASQKLTVEQLQAALLPVKEKLLAKRSRRERPLTDTKILTGWNGLMIRGMADTGQVLDENRYVEAAARAADFVLAKLRKPDGRLLRTFREDQAKLNAYVDDYSFLVSGLMALHRATDDAKWLNAARELTDRQIELFWDDQRGGFFFTSHDHETLIARGKDPTDGAIPSGNSVAAANLLALAKALEAPEYRDRARKTIEAVLPWAEGSPEGTCGTAHAAAILLNSTRP